MTIPMTPRIYSSPATTRRQYGNGAAVTFLSSYTARAARHTYRQLRDAGVSVARARWSVFDLLAAHTRFQVLDDDQMVGGAL